MSLGSVCICTVTRMILGCPRHAPGDTGTPESHHAMLIRIIENQEKIMAAQDDVNTAAAAMTSAANTISTVAADLTAAQANVQTEIANLNAAIAAGSPVDTTALNQAVAGLSAPIAALQAADTAVDSLETPAPPAPAAPADGTAGSTVSGGDAGSAS